MRYTVLSISMLSLAALCTLSGCVADSPEEGKPAAYTRLLMTVSIPTTDIEIPEARVPSASDGFENFDNEKDKWGVQGENIETLRIIILDGDGNVEHNRFYADLADAVAAGAYEYKVRNNDLKTVILLANEGYYLLDEQGMEIAGGTTSLSRYLNSFPENSYIDAETLKSLTLALKHNSPDDKGLSLKTPLPISAIYSEYVSTSGEDECLEREYMMHRAAVKYSFRIINKSDFNHTLEGIRINRIADREFVFPNATYTVNSLGHQVIESYSTPATASEQAYENADFRLELAKNMTQAVAVMDPIYVPEGIVAEEPQQVSIALDGAPLQVWRDLKWVMPGEDEAAARPMADLPRNTHVVVNITIKDDNTLDMVAEVQPYAGVELRPSFGLDRDPDGNIIIERYPDGTYDIIDDGDRVTKDADGDEVKYKFADGSLYCVETVYKDYIHDSSEVDYVYHFEKDYSGGNMVIIRAKSTGGTYHGDTMPEHEHGKDDRAVFVLNKKGDFEYVTYDDEGNPTYHDHDMLGDEIIQANGFQFRNVGEMSKYIGSYVVRKADGTEELRYYLDGCTLDWETGVEGISTRSSAVSAAVKEHVLSAMRMANRLPLDVLNGRLRLHSRESAR